MKKLRSLFFVLAATTAAFVMPGCDGEGIGTFNATTGTGNYTAIAPFAALTGNQLTITGASAQQQIVITLNAAAPGTYTVGVQSEGATNHMVYIPNITTPQTFYASVSGSVVLTEVAANRVSGNFQASLTDTNLGTIAVTGSFADVLYP